MLNIFSFSWKTQFSLKWPNIQENWLLKSTILFSYKQNSVYSLRCFISRYGYGNRIINSWYNWYWYIWLYPVNYFYCTMYVLRTMEIKICVLCVHPRQANYKVFIILRLIFRFSETCVTTIKNVLLTLRTSRFFAPNRRSSLVEKEVFLKETTSSCFLFVLIFIYLLLYTIVSYSYINYILYPRSYTFANLKFKLNIQRNNHINFVIFVCNTSVYIVKVVY